MNYKQSILKIAQSRKFLKIIKKINTGRLIITGATLIPIFIPEALAIDL